MIVSELIIVNIILNLVLLSNSSHQPFQHPFWRALNLLRVLLKPLTTLVYYFECLHQGSLYVFYPKSAVRNIICVVQWV